MSSLRHIGKDTARPEASDKLTGKAPPDHLRILDTHVAYLKDSVFLTDVENLILRFDDAATDLIPRNPVPSLQSGTYRPANYEGETTDNFPTPAPGGPYPTNLSTFQGEVPNGDWMLYIIDDTPSDSGAISNGWSLTISTEPVIVGLEDTATAENKTALVPFTMAAEPFADAEFTFTASSTNQLLVLNENITFEGSGTNWTCVVEPNLNSSGQTEITVFATNLDGQTVNDSFILTVSAVNQPPEITQVPDQLTVAGQPTAAIPFKISDPETPTRVIEETLVKTSSNPKLIPVDNIIIEGNVLRIVPIGAETGETTISMMVNDPEGLEASTTFIVTVLESSSPLFANSSPIVINDKSIATPYPSTIEVSGIPGDITQVTVTLAQLDHQYPADLDILLVGPDGRGVILMSDAGGSEDLVNTRIGFDDFAANPLPENSLIPNYGTWRPTNYGSGDLFPAPAPGGPYGNALNVFQGTDANGTWSLYILDDESPDNGELSGGWLLNIITTTPRISAIPPQTTAENVPLLVEFQVDDSDTPVDQLVVQAEGNNPEVIRDVIVGGSGRDRSLLLLPATDAFGVANILVSVNDGSHVATTVFPVTVTAVNQPPTITGLASRYETPANTPLRAPFVVDDRETPVEQLETAAFILNAELGSVNIAGSGANLEFVFIPSGVKGETSAAVFVSDGELTTTNDIELVTISERGPLIAPIPDQFTPEDTALDVAISIGNTTSENLVVLGFAADKTVIQSVNIIGTGIQRTARVTPTANASGNTLITIFANDEFGGDTESFVMTVTPINDPPVLEPIPDQTTLVNVAAVVPLVIYDSDTPMDELTIGGGSPNSELVSSVDFSREGTNVTATVNLVQDATGEAQVTIFVSDEQTTVNQTFTLTVGADAEPATLTISVSGTTALVELKGSPNTTYDILISSDLVTWELYAQVTTDADGNASGAVDTTEEDYVFVKASFGE